MSTSPSRGLHTLVGAGSRGPTVIPPPASRWKTRVLLPTAIGVVVVAMLIVTLGNVLVPATPVRVVPVVLKPVAGGGGTATVLAPGWLEPDPVPHYVAALTDGVVADVLVLEGDRVQVGQVLARLVDDDAQLAVRRADAEVVMRRAELASAVADRDAAHQTLDHLVERTRTVAVAEARVAEAEGALIKHEAEIAVERARLLELRDAWNRKLELVAVEAVSEAAVAALRFQVDAQEAVVRATEADEGVLRALLHAAEAEQAAARMDARLLTEERRAAAHADAAVGRVQGAVALAEARRDEASLRLERMSIRAPIDGVVLRRLIVPGSKVLQSGNEHSAHIMHLYDPAHLQVRVDVPLADAAQIAIGQSAEITVEVLPDHVYHGHVTRLVHEADIQKNTVEVKVAIDDPTDAIKPEMLARVRFLASMPSGEVRRRPFVPESLVTGKSGDSSTLVVGAVVDGRGRVERRSLTLGSHRLDGWIAVDGGVQAGDLLVVDASGSLKDGDRVQVTGEVDEGDTSWR